MSHTNESEFRGPAKSRARPRGTQRILPLLCGAILVVLLPCSGGCSSPGALVGGAIVGSILYAHLRQDSLSKRQETVPPPVSGRRTYAGSRRTMATYAASHPPAPRTEPPSSNQAVTASPLAEGALAYREVRWEDAVRVLNQAIDAGTCTGRELGQAHLLLGAIAYQQGDAEAARRHFVEAHRRDPQLALSPRLFPPQLIDFYQTIGGP
jgi:tetratricopeptide (TPR) repeat protein